MKLSLLLECH